VGAVRPTQDGVRAAAVRKYFDGYGGGHRVVSRPLPGDSADAQNDQQPGSRGTVAASRYADCSARGNPFGSATSSGHGLQVSLVDNLVAGRLDPRRPFQFVIDAAASRTHANADAYCHTNGTTDSHSHTDSNAHADWDCYAVLNPNAKTNPKTNPDTLSYGYQGDQNLGAITGLNLKER